MQAETIWGVLAVVFGGGGVWAFLRSMRGATSSEYQSFVKDLQVERRDRQDAIARLERRCRRLDAKILKLTRANAVKDLEFGELEAHVARLEGVITDLGGRPPKRPTRIRVEEPGDDEEDDDDELALEEEPPAQGGEQGSGSKQRE